MTTPTGAPLRGWPLDDLDSAHAATRVAELERDAALRTAANAAEALRAERQKAANVKFYLMTMLAITTHDEIRAEVAAIYAGEPEPGRT